MPGDGYSPTQIVTVNKLDGTSRPIPYAYYLGDNPDENGWVESWSGDGGPEVTVWIVCAWDNRTDMIRALRGQVQMQGLNVKRIEPSFVLDPPFADAGMAWGRFVCTSIGEFKRIKTRIAQVDDDGIDPLGGLYSDEVAFPCNFEVPLYQTGPGPYDQGDPSGKAYTTTIIRPEGEVVSPPAGAYQFKNGGAGPPQLVQDTQAGFYFGRTELAITRVFMPYSGSDQMQEVVGCVNSEAIKFVDTTYPLGTVLLTGIDSRPYIDPGSGNTVWDITYNCIVNAGKNGTTAKPWTQIMNSQGVYTEIVDKDGNPPFPSIDLESEIWYDIVNAA